MGGGELGVSFGDDENVLKLGNGCTTLNQLNTTDLYILNGCIVWYANYTSIKLLSKKNEGELLIPKGVQEASHGSL